MAITSAKTGLSLHDFSVKQLQEILSKADAHYDCDQKQTLVTFYRDFKQYSVSINSLITRIQNISANFNGRRRISLAEEHNLERADIRLAELDECGRTEYKRLNLFLRLTSPINPPYQRVTKTFCYA